MRIGIDVSQIVYKTGVSKYTLELVNNLLSLDKKNEYCLFFSSLRNNFSKSLFPSINSKTDIKIFKFPQTLLEIIWNRWHIMPVEKLIGKVDIFHSSDWIQPPAYAKKVTTVHDLSFLRYPETFPQKIIDVHKRRLYWVKKEGCLVIADSEATKKDLVNLLGFNENKIKVVYLGVNKITNNIQKPKYKIPKNYLIYVGTIEPRKNLKRLIKAFALALNKLEDKKISLFICGKKGWLYEEVFNEAKKLNLEKQIVFTGYISDEEKQFLLKNAIAFVYPSLYEGFGLPVLEAMAAGCPVITSKISSLPEVAGKAAFLVDPQSEKEISEAIVKLISSKSQRHNLRQKGLKQILKFSWQQTARETLKVYYDAYWN